MKNSDEEKFAKDWEYYSNVENLARELFDQGYTIEETKNQVLQSIEYKEWLAEKRGFIAQFTEDGFYHDLKSNQILEHHIREIEGLAEELFVLAQGKHKPNIEEFTRDKSQEDDWLPLTLGFHLNIYELAYELVQLGKLIKLDRPMPVMYFLNLLNGTSMLPYREEVIAKIVENETSVIEFAREFGKKYGREKEI